MYQVITLYIINLHNVVCQLHVNKTGEKERVKVAQNRLSQNPDLISSKDCIYKHSV